jgi:hypothetical protein
MNATWVCVKKHKHHKNVSLGWGRVALFSTKKLKRVQGRALFFSQKKGKLCELETKTMNACNMV